MFYLQPLPSGPPYRPSNGTPQMYFAFRHKAYLLSDIFLSHAFVAYLTRSSELNENARVALNLDFSQQIWGLILRKAYAALLKPHAMDKLAGDKRGVSAAAGCSQNRLIWVWVQAARMAGHVLTPKRRCNQQCRISVVWVALGHEVLRGTDAWCSDCRVKVLVSIRYNYYWENGLRHMHTTVAMQFGGG